LLVETRGSSFPGQNDLDSVIHLSFFVSLSTLTRLRGRVWPVAPFFGMLCIVLLASAAGDEKRITIYSPIADYSLNVSDRDGREYVGLLEILEPLGSVTAKIDKDNWKLRFNSIEAQFTKGQNRARIRGRDFELPARFLIENGRGLVPIDSLVTLLPQFLGIPVVFHVNSRRLFISETGTTYTAELSKSAPGKLVLNFSRPVNPNIATEPGKLRMSFVRDPVLASGPQAVNFNDKSITSAFFQESNGSAELTVAGNVSLLASFSNDGRTITVSPTPAPNTAASAPTTPAIPPATAVLPTPAPAPTPTPAPVRHFLVIVDASHGGNERGAALSDKVAEKDVTLAFARRIRQELEARGIPALVLRDGDATLGLDERATAVNTQHPAIYIAVHAANDSSGVRVYTAMLPSDLTARGPFLAWDGAQAPSLGMSQLAAAVITTELRKKVAARSMAAPLRPLNNIATPAIAIEVAEQSGDVSDLVSADYQGAISIAIAAGVENVRPRLEGQR
jgi:N-acetylmuramoyl-L-alanine amidase